VTPTFSPPSITHLTRDNSREHNRHRAGFFLQYCDGVAGSGEDDIWRARHQLPGVSTEESISCAPANVEAPATRRPSFNI
jgi:hypothetical protein